MKTRLMVAFSLLLSCGTDPDPGPISLDSTNGPVQDGSGPPAVDTGPVDAGHNDDTTPPDTAPPPPDGWIPCLDDCPDGFECVETPAGGPINSECMAGMEVPASVSTIFSAEDPRIAVDEDGWCARSAVRHRVPIAEGGRAQLGHLPAGLAAAKGRPVAHRPRIWRSFFLSDE